MDIEEDIKEVYTVDLSYNISEYSVWRPDSIIVDSSVRNLAIRHYSHFSVVEWLYQEYLSPKARLLGDQR